MKQKVISLLAAVTAAAMLLPLSALAAGAADVPEARWSSAYIADVVEKGVMTLEDGSFAPERTATRPEAFAAVEALTGQKAEESADGPITRGEMAAILYAAARFEGAGFTGTWAFQLPYADAGEVPEEQYEALCWLTMNHVFNGYADGRIAPTDPLTREQLAAVLYRFQEAISAPTGNTYTLNSSHEVAGRQGVAAEGEFYWVSGSTTLTKYDKDWNLLAENNDPFSEGYENEVNHIGDIDVYRNEVYCGVELFLDGAAKNIQIAVYDGDSLKLKRSFNFEPNSGHTEVSGIAVDPENNSVWMCSWANGETGGDYLYRYDLTSGEYLGKVRMDPAPQRIQGVACHDGYFYVTADDGEADKDEPDAIWRGKIVPDAETVEMAVERRLDDVTRQGEIEGLTFDTETNQMLVLYNRGARIILGMPTGFYEGYDHELHEVFTYDIG